MPQSRPIDPAAQPGPGSPDEEALEHELEQAERRRRAERERRLLGDHPDGIGPTLGQDLSRPNPGRTLDWDDLGWDRPA